ncbi:LamG domain-containing protein, partial [bacterium]|nr:LamG domain-containing protein [bacterium]MBU1024669.1 LamG domain-containing protein [bacterium]
MWLKPTSGHVAYSYTWQKGDAKLYAYDTSATSYAVNPSPYESPYNIYITLAPNVWNHVVTVAFNSGSGKNFTAYVNGQYVESKLYPSPITDVLTNNFHIGGDISGNRRYFNGSIDEVMVFKTNLSAAQVSAIYNNQSARFKTEGTIETKQYNISAGDSVVNVTFRNYERDLGSNISVRVGEWDQSRGYNETDFSGLDSLLSYYHFDEASWGVCGDCITDAMGYNDLDNNGATNPVNTYYPFYNVAPFNGVNDYFDDNDLGTLNGVDLVTITAWVQRKGASINGYETIVIEGAGQSGYQLTGSCNDGNLRFDVRSGTSSVFTASTSNSIITDGEWHFLAGVYDGDADVVYLYVDGEQKANASADTDVGNPARGLHIGGNTWNQVCDGSTSDGFWNGSMDEVMIFNRSLSSDEINELYVKGRALWSYSGYQNLTAIDSNDNESLNEFDIDTTTTNILPMLKLFSGANQFYTPLVTATTSTPATFVSFSASFPNITIISPLNNSYQDTESPDFNVSLNEAGSWCGFSVNGAANITLTAFNSTYFFDNRTLKMGWLDGYHNVVFSCNGTKNDYSVSEAYFLIDTTLPEILFVTPTPADNSFMSKNSTYINVSSSDANDHYSFVDWDNSLVGWWRMDDDASVGENDTHVYDWSGKGNNGTAYNDASPTTAGRFGGGFEFDGYADYISVGNIGAEDNWTISVWGKTLGNAIGSQYIITPTGSDGILTGNPGASWGFWDGTSGISGSVTQSGVWSHYVVTKNGTFYSIYKNSTLEKNGTLLDVDISNLGIGRRGTTTFNFNGSIDEVLIFNRSLSAAEISALYNASANQYYNNFTGLGDKSSHTFQAYAADRAGNKNATGARTIYLDYDAPSVFFVNPTPYNDSSFRGDDSFVINITVGDDTSDTFAFLDWDNSLFLWYDMDTVNSSGDPQDLSGQGYHAVAAGSALQDSTGRFGESFVVDTSNNVVSGPSITTNLTEYGFTKSIWFKFDQPPTTGQTDYLSYFYASASDSFQFRAAENAGSYELSVWGELNNDGFTVTKSGMTLSDLLDDWHHLAAVYNLTDVIFYVDGANEGFDGTSNEQISQTFISNLFGYDLYGNVDEVLLFSRALSEQEVLSLYNASANQLEKNVSGLDDGSHVFEAYAIDQAGNKNQTEQRTVKVVNPEAFEKLGIPSNPYDYDNSANWTNYDQIASGSDESYYATTLADTDGQYDSQIFIFRTKENTTAIGTLNLTWQGYGETQAGYLTNISLFDWTTGNWVGINSTDFTSANNLTLDLNVVSGVSNYLNNTEGDNKVAVLVTTRKYAVAECGAGHTDNGDGTCTASSNLSGTMADDDTVGTQTWSNVDNAKIDDGNYASVSVSMGTLHSHYLKATNFGFSIPEGVTINGILMEVKRYGQGNDLPDDEEVKIVKSDGSVGSENKAIGGDWNNGGNEVYISYGGAEDLWSESWSDADINNANFGTVMSAQSGSTLASIAWVNHIRINVTYTLPSSPFLYT